MANKHRMIEVKLTGGPHNGKAVWVTSFQPYFYLQTPLAAEQINALKTDDPHINWKWPEAVYEKASKTEFRYKHTVHYKPREGGQLEIEAINAATGSNHVEK